MVCMIHHEPLHSILDSHTSHFATQTVCWNSSAIHPTIQRYGKAEEAEEKNEEQKDEKKEEILGKMRKLFFFVAGYHP